MRSKTTAESRRLSSFSPFSLCFFSPFPVSLSFLSRPSGWYVLTTNIRRNSAAHPAPARRTKRQPNATSSASSASSAHQAAAQRNQQRIQRQLGAPSGSPTQPAAHPAPAYGATQQTAPPANQLGAPSGSPTQPAAHRAAAQRHQQRNQQVNHSGPRSVQQTALGDLQNTQEHLQNTAVHVRTPLMHTTERNRSQLSTTERD